MNYLSKILLIVVVIAGHTTFAQRLNDKSVATIEQAMTDELMRSKEKLRLAGLTDLFYVSYTVTDNVRLDISAAFGALTKSQEAQSRQFSLRLMVGDYHLNDENFQDNSGGLFFGGGGAQIDQVLPLDDDYNVIRRGLWLATDNLFKDANETFTKKKAALERKQLSEEDKNLPDFARAPIANVTEQPKELSYDRKALENFIRELSSVFLKYPELQNSGVTLTHNNSYQIFKSTEGTSFRRPALTCDLTVQASAQAFDDGEPMSLAFTVSAPSPDLLDKADIKQKTEQLAKTLTDLINAPKYGDKEYTGPVIFEGDACRSLIGEHLIAKFAAQREDVLGGSNVFVMGGAPKGTFQKKMGTRVLPSSVTVHDHPLMKSKSGTQMLGNYSIDDEGVVPKDLVLVEKGILKNLYLTRTPTKELKEPNGHARNAGGSTVPGPGVVEITDAKAVASLNMKKDLIKRAKENGYDFAFIVRSLDKGTLLFTDGMGNFGDMLEGQKSIQPSLVYKVSVKDGSEELIRGVELSFPTPRDLREIITSKERSTVDINLPGGGNAGLFGFGGKVAATIIGPERIMFPELEARKKKTSAYPTRPVVARPN